MPIPFSSSKYALVLFAFAVLGMLYPALAAGIGGRVIWTVSFSGLLILVVWAACRRPHHRIVGAVLATLSIASEASLMALELHGTWWANVGIAIVVGFLGFATLVVLGDVLEGRRVTLDKIFGAACVYLLIGLTFAMLFQFVYGVVGKGSFAFPLGPVEAGFDGEGGDTLPTFLYHSFVTLTTLGYGDVVPVDPWARLLSSTEAIVGQLYLTILVARLVGLHISQRGVT